MKIRIKVRTPKSATGEKTKRATKLVSLEDLTSVESMDSMMCYGPTEKSWKKHRKAQAK